LIYRPLLLNDACAACVKLGK